MFLRGPGMDGVRADVYNHGNYFFLTLFGKLWELIDFIVKILFVIKPVVKNGNIVVLIVNNPRNVLCFNLRADG